MICVFLSFVLGADPTVKMIGLGLATAVFVDATIIRMVLVPATMELLGDCELVAAAAGSTGSCPTSTSRPARPARPEFEDGWTTRTPTASGNPPVG